MPDSNTEREPPDTPGPESEPRGNFGGGEGRAAWEALRESLENHTDLGHGAGLRCVELCPICRAADVLRTTGSPELRGQLSDLQHEALLTLRTLIDHYIERLDTPAKATGEVEEIPIE